MAEAYFNNMQSTMMLSSNSPAFIGTGSSNPLSSAGSAGSVSPLASSSMARPNEVKLYSNSKEREQIDHLAELFSIIRTVDALEKAYTHDSVSVTEYQAACSKLLIQFRTAKRLAGVHDVAQFMRDYQLNCTLAYHRLVEVGIPDVPAPVGTIKIVAEAVQYFITLMDSLKLGMVAVDEVQPLLGDLMAALNQINTLPPDFEAKAKVQHWLTTLNKMKASDELSKEQIRQMMFDLEQSYNAFHRAI